ncbi:MAG TPA: alanine racemase [Patescibacteria group bacterium]|nr:alanine racemase [Patescibacteria group bacterium]
MRIFKDALLHNLQAYQKAQPSLQFAPVLKSNAYGHGLVPVARILDSAPKPFFVVDSFYEALTLRQAGIKSPLLMLGFNQLEQLLRPRLKNCAMAIIDFATLEQVAAKLKQPARYHLKIDTGMHRQGILPEQIERAIGLIKANPNFILEGLCSHLADADGLDRAFTEKQIKVWNEAATEFQDRFPNLKYLHLAASAGTFYAGKIKANAARLGLGLYGFNASPFVRLPLQPALEMASVIATIRSIPAGEKIGYNATWQAARSTLAATVPAGYSEGVDRRLSNRGFYRIGEKFCPLIGRVSMNISSVDITDAPQARLGDEVIIISRRAEDKNSAQAIAELCQTIVYEILVHIPAHLRRVII